MSRQVSPSTRRPYGLQRVARLWGVARATVYRHRRPDRGERRRPGPVGAMPDEALVEAIRKLLRDQGQRTRSAGSVRGAPRVRRWYKDDPKLRT